MSVSTKTRASNQIASSQVGNSPNRWVICAVVAVIAAVSVVVFSPRAHAITTEKGGELVLDARVTPESSFADPLPDVEQDPHEVLAGREQCERLVRDETPVTFEIIFSGTIGNLVTDEDVMFFATPDSGTPEGFECDHEDQDDCYGVAGETTIFDTGVADGDGGTGNVRTVEIDFDELVDEAIEGLTHEDTLVPIESAAGCHPDDENAFDQQYIVRLLIRGDNTSREPMADAAIRIDTIRPPSPSAIVDVTATESTLHLVWEQAERDDAERYHAFWSTEDITGMDIEALQDSGAQRAQITLQNDDPDGTTFEGTVGLEGVDTDDPDERVFVAIVSRDPAENFSQPAFAEDGVEVLPVIDFWEGYREAGGSERGGCASAGGSLPAGAMGLLLFAGGLLWHRRRRS